MDGWPLQSSLTLVALPSAAFWARRHTEDVLVGWGLPEGVVEVVLLVVSELISNGVEATAGGLDAKEQELYDRAPVTVPYERIARLGMVRLRLSYDYVRVLVEVWDGGEGVPVVQVPSEEAESGRGLLLVASLCERWGWYPVGEEAGRPGWPGGRWRKGKVVWGGVVLHSKSE
jgi:anti-sigma regulatory factor (Ser/Thr protein kinase)